MRTILAILLAVSFIPAIAALEDDARALQEKDAWQLGENLEAGDTFRYLVCDVRSSGTCYHADLNFLAYDGESGLWTVYAIFQDVLGHTVEGKYGAERIMSVSGSIEEDLVNMTYITLRHAADPINGTYYTDDTFFLKHPDGYYTNHARSLFDSVMLIGGKVPIGSGTVLEYPAKLAMGVEWTVPSTPASVLVTSANSNYRHGTISVNDVYNVEYASSRPVAYVQILDGFPFPLQGEVIADRAVLQQDPYVQFDFWYKLLDTNRLDDAPGTAPDDIFALEPPTLLGEIVLALPPTGIPIVDEANATIDLTNLPDPSENPLEDITKDLANANIGSLYDQFLDWLGVNGGSAPVQESLLTITTDANSYNLGDTVVFSGVAARDIGSDAAIITLSIANEQVASIPVSIRDGLYELSVETHSWDFAGVIQAQIDFAGDSAGTAFEFVNIEAAEDIPEVEYRISGRTVSELSVYGGSILVFLDSGANGTDGVIHLDIPDPVIPVSPSETFDVYVDSLQSSYDREMYDGGNTLSVSIDMTTKVIEVSSRELKGGFTCMGQARCIETTVTRIIDGDTVKMREGQNVRFALASAPELSEDGGAESKQFMEEICPVGSDILVDEDDLQGESYSRVVGVVYCNGYNLNEALVDDGGGYVLTRFCGGSEFSQTDWAQRHGC